MFKGVSENTVVKLIAPAINASYCWYTNSANADGEQIGTFYRITTISIVKSSTVLVISLAIILANIIFIMIVNSKAYSTSIQHQPRYLLTCLASNDLAIGILVTCASILPTLIQCWPYGYVVCQLQALLRGSLTRQSSMILMCMAIDRYFCAVHPCSYRRYFNNNKVFMIIICVTLVILLTIFAATVITGAGFYFNTTGFFGCDLFYSRSSFRILSACIFYFPTTMLLMYCYGKVYHIDLKNRYFHDKTGILKVKCHRSSQGEVNYDETNESISRTMAVISLSFTIMTTPWTIYEVVAACTGYKIPSSVEFIITWITFSNSFLNPFLYWLLNEHFHDVLSNKIFRKQEHTVQQKMYCQANGNCNQICEMKLMQLTANGGISHYDKFDSNSFCPTPPPPPNIGEKIWKPLY